MRGAHSIFLACGWTGNLAPFWREYVHSGGHPRKRFCDTPGEDELLGLLETASGHGFSGYNILESYYYIADHKYFGSLLETLPMERFQLDSGAFTFMNHAATHVDWDAYTEKYAEFINKHDIKHFYELDIDSITGLDKVEVLRIRLERLTGKQCIPVWHRARGQQYWLDLVREYRLVAMGGIASGEDFRVAEYPYFAWFVKTAHAQGTRVHGLGFTPLGRNVMFNYFDSVDSTAWLYGSKSGFVYRFDGRTLVKHERPGDKKLRSRNVAMNNFYLERRHR